MEEEISNFQHHKKKMNAHKPVTAEEISAELTYLHKKFPFVPKDLETHKSTGTFNKTEEGKSWKEKHL